MHRGKDRIRIDWISGQLIYRLYDEILATRAMGGGNMSLTFPPEHCTKMVQDRLQAIMTKFQLGTVQRRNGKWIVNGVEVS